MLASLFFLVGHILCVDTYHIHEWGLYYQIDVWLNPTKYPAGDTILSFEGFVEQYSKSRTLYIGKLPGDPITSIIRDHPDPTISSNALYSSDPSRWWEEYNKSNPN